MLINEIYEILELRNKTKLSFRDIEASYQNIHARLIKSRDANKLALKQLEAAYKLCRKLFCHDFSYNSSIEKSVGDFADFIVFLEESLDQCPKEDLWKVAGFVKSCLISNESVTPESKSIISAATVNPNLCDILNELGIKPHPGFSNKTKQDESERKEAIINNIIPLVKRTGANNKRQHRQTIKKSRTGDKVSCWNELASRYKFSQLNGEIQQQLSRDSQELRLLFNDKRCNTNLKKQLHYTFQAAKVESYVKQRSGQSGYLHWYGRFFGYHRNVKVSAAEKLGSCLTSGGDFRALFSLLDEKEKQALQQGELGKIYDRCWKIMCDSEYYELPNSTEFIRPQ